MEDKVLIPNLQANDFEFAQQDEHIHDLKFDTKPIGYFKDAWLRFRKSRASIVGAVIIILIFLYAIIVPITAGHSASETDRLYVKKVPFNQGLANSLHVCEGCYTKECNPKSYLLLESIAIGHEFPSGENIDTEVSHAYEMNPVRSIKSEYQVGSNTYRSVKVQAYYEVGFYDLQVSQEQYQDFLAWEQETGEQLLFPMIDESNIESVFSSYPNLGVFWYCTTDGGWPIDNDGNRITTLEGMKNVKLNYVYDSDGNQVYAVRTATTDVKVRLWYWSYYKYLHNGNIPSYFLGTDELGRDISVRLASGVGLSLLLGVSTFLINFILGAIYGSIEGYYGGLADLIMERISDILADMPFVVLASIVNIRLISTGKMSPFGAILFAFILTGWIGPAYRVRTQFYRFKNQEYVLAARTLGANDARIMFKHIFPNTLGTIITSSVLTIPGTIFSESSLSYLGIINLNQGNITSLGTLLASGQQYMTTYPHIIFPPCVVISLLMISFNLFGNGLRDAFNPSLRGVEE